MAEGNGDPHMIGNLEEAIIKKIKDALVPDRLGYSATVQSFGGDFAAGIERAIKNFPAIVIVYTGATMVKESQQTYQHVHNFNIMVCAKNLRNEKTTRYGGAAGEVGSYQMVDDMLRLLSGAVLKSEEGKPLNTPLSPRGVRAVLNDNVNQQLASVYSIDFSTTLSFEAIRDSAIDDFATFHANWDVPTHGNVSTTLPADDTADATDTVTLET
jgi:phage gp37-like protein